MFFSLVCRQMYCIFTYMLEESLIKGESFPGNHAQLKGPPSPYVSPDLENLSKNVCVGFIRAQ